MNVARTGTFLVLDGNDGSGKATQAALLVDALQKEGIPATKIDFPRYHTNVMGKLIGECLSGAYGDFVGLDPRITSVLYAADRFESAGAIREALAEGKVVVADRYASSNQIHQGGKIESPEDRKRFLRWLEEVEYGVFGIPKPDAVVYLKVPVTVSLELLTQKREAKIGMLADGETDQAEQDRQYLERSHDTALWLSEREPNWLVVDCVDEAGAMRSRDSIHDELLAAVRSRLLAASRAS